MRAPINKIIPLSTVDGPGLRTSVFFQGCNAKCLFCHNPETQNLCLNCGACIPTCKGNALSMVDGKVVYDPTLCVNCDTCIQVCQHHASPKVEYLTPEEVFSRIKKNVGFIRGITVSGGECSLYIEFLTELFALAKKENLTCLMDSNGLVDLSKYPELLSLTDGVMLDVKAWDEKLHESYIGTKNEVIKKNLVFLAFLDKLTEVRIVCTPGYTDVKECLNGIYNALPEEKRSSTKIKLITFRKNGVKGVLKNHPSPTKEEMESYRNYAVSLGFQNIDLR